MRVEQSIKIKEIDMRNGLEDGCVGNNMDAYPGCGKKQNQKSELFLVRRKASCR